MQVGNRVLMVCIRNAERLLTLRSSDAAGLVWVRSPPLPQSDSQGPPTATVRGRPARGQPPNLPCPLGPPGLLTGDTLAQKRLSMFLAAALNPQRYHGSNIRRQFQRPNQVLRWGAGGERGYTQGECYRGGGGGLVRRRAALRGVKPATAFVLSEESWLLSDRDRAFPSPKTALLRIEEPHSAPFVPAEKSLARLCRFTAQAPPGCHPGSSAVLDVWFKDNSSTTVNGDANW